MRGFERRFCLYFQGSLATLSYCTAISCRFAILQLWHGLLGIFRPKIINLLWLKVKNKRCWDSPSFYLLLICFQRVFYTQCVKPCIANLKRLTIDVFVVWKLTKFFFALLPNLSVRSLPFAHNCYSGQPQMGAERTKPRWAPDYLLGSSFNFGSAVQVDVQNDQSFDSGFGSSSSNK